MRYKWLGPIEAELDGAAVPLGGPQQRRLLGVLLAHRDQAVSNDRLVDALWSGESAPDGAARSIKTYVSRLRVALGEGSIAHHGNGYRLDHTDVATDVDEFEALVSEGERALPDRAIAAYDAAIGLWRGPPFGEFADEWWAVAESVRLDELRIVAREQRAAALLAIGHHQRAVPDLEGLTVELPLRERPMVLLLQAFHASGRQAEALRRYQGFRRRLVEETGLEPSPELIAVERSIAGGEGLHDAVSGRPLRGYVIHEPIGEGTFGRVYAATQPGTGRRVAIKAIRPDLVDASDFIRRFEAEARIVARLEHPHIVPLYDYWREPGGAYLVFRLLSGGNVREALVTDGTWSLLRVSRLIEEVGGALIAAHAAGVTHNDLRAANVVLDEEGVSYLTDFGIALDDDRNGDGDGQHQDLRGLAVLAWELLTGSPVEDGRSAPSLIGRLSSVPVGLDATLAKATSGPGEDRFGSVAEFVLAWRSAVGRPEGVLSPLTSDDRRAADSARRVAARDLTRTTTAGVNPYKGLRPFDEADAAGFVGREEVVTDLIELVADCRLVTVVGASGSGKSSVVRAGLVPALRAEGRSVVTMVPGEDPARALDNALLEVAKVAPTDDDVLAHVAATSGPLVVVIDQFEECWTSATSERREPFLATLTAAVIDGDADLRIVTTVRADLLDRPLQHATVGPLLGAGTRVLTPLSPEQVNRIIMIPAERSGVTFDEAVVARLVSDAVAQPGALPLLQFALTELYDHRVDGSVSAAALAAIGGLAGAVGRRADQVFTALDADARADARELFSRMVVPGGLGPDTRRRARFSELTPGARVVAEPFVAARLLVIDRDDTSREPTLEVAHEALLTRWERLQGWIDDDREWLTTLQHLATATRGWDDGGRADSELYRGSRLESGLEALEAGRGVSQLERTFLLAGRQARDADSLVAHRTAQRLRRLLVGAGAALLLAGAAGGSAFWQGHEADRSAAAAQGAERDARVEALVGRSQALRSTQRDTAVLLAVEANRLADTPQTRSALLGQLTSATDPLDTHRLPGDVGRAGIVLPDGASAFVIGADGRLRPYDLASGSVGEPFPVVDGDADGFAPLVASPDSRLVAQLRSSEDGDGTITTTIGVFDAATGQAETGLISVTGQVNVAAFSNDGRSLYVSLDPEARIEQLDTTTGRVLARAVGVAVPRDATGFPAGGLAVSADGLVLVGGPTGALRVLDPRSLERVATIQRPEGTLETIQALSDGTVVASGWAGVTRFEVPSGATVWRQVDGAYTCLNLRVIEAAEAVFCGDVFGRLIERDLATSGVRRSLDAQNGNIGALWAAADGNELVGFGANEPVVVRWRLDGSGPITHVVAPGWTVTALSPDGRRLIIARPDSTVIEPSAFDYEQRIIDVATGDTVTELEGFYSPFWIDENTLIGAVLEGDRPRIARRDLITGRTTADGAVLDGGPTSVAGEPGKSRFLISFPVEGGSEVRSFDEDGQRIEPTIRVDDLVSMSSSADGDRIALGTTRGVAIHDGSTGDQLGVILGADLRAGYITAADELFVTSLGGELTEHDLQTRAPIRTLGGSRGFIQQLTGTADGATIAVMGGDRVVTLYDVGSGLRLGDPLTLSDEELVTMSLSLDGSTLALGGGISGGIGGGIGGGVGHPIRVVDLRSDHWAEAACRLAGRNLTHEEWVTNIGDLADYRLTCPDLAPG